MVTDLFGNILEDVSIVLQLPTLQSDKNNSCLIKFQDDLRLQMEVDRGAEFIIFMAELGEVFPGRYKENIFREALRANNEPYPRYGYFAYRQQAKVLVLLDMIPVREVNQDKLKAFLIPFIDKARVWKEAIKRGEIPQSSVSSSREGGALFGLKP